MNRILVAVDFSAPSRRAFRVAVELSRAFRARLRVVYVAHSAGGTPEPGSPLVGDAPGFQRTLQTFVLQEFRGSAAEFANLELKVLRGRPDRKILEEAESCEASLIVVGNQPRNAVEKLFTGSVSDEVMAQSDLPVLVVKGESESRPIKILATVDGRSSTKCVLGTAAAWSTALGAELKVVHVMPELPEPVCVRFYPNSDLRSGTRELMANVQRDVDSAVREAFPGEDPPALEYRVGTAHKEIVALAEEDQFDLVIIGLHQRRGYLDFSNTASQVARTCPCSVLIARPVSARAQLEEVRK